MTSDFESAASTETAEPARSHRWMQVGLVAAASALVGGVAAAWWYRKTLEKLRGSGEGVPHVSTETPGDPLDDL